MVVEVACDVHDVHEVSCFRWITRFCFGLATERVEQRETYFSVHKLTTANGYSQTDVLFAVLAEVGVL